MSVYVDGLVLAILKPALTGVHVLSEQPIDLPSMLDNGIVVAKHVGGAGWIDRRFTSATATVQIDGYAAGKRDAFDLCADALGALEAAWANQTVTADGWITNLTPQLGPTELRVADQSSGFTRYTATVSLACRA